MADWARLFIVFLPPRRACQLANRHAAPKSSVDFRITLSDIGQRAVPESGLWQGGWATGRADKNPLVPECELITPAI